MRKRMNKLQDENEDLRNGSMQSTLIFRGVPENEHLTTSCLIAISRLNLDYDEFCLELCRKLQKQWTIMATDQFLLHLSTGVMQMILGKE